ncbi:MAG: flagellar biosynthesis anti-sigma factor FlgM [Clostridiales bacterium]|jgi:negative regulator of flagellin synthesis FlgM|nr:flagellar biosynthesis anti-sigma factor FlgM [Clostridiales bacterium]
MRIDALNKVSQLYKASSTQNTTKVKASSYSDKVEISSEGKAYHNVKQVLNQVPDIRADKVNELKQKIQSGTYNISAEEVADKMISRYFNQTI